MVSSFRRNQSPSEFRPKRGRWPYYAAIKFGEASEKIRDFITQVKTFLASLAKR
jgi:hypothetical protein